MLAAEEPGRLTPYRNSPAIARMVARAVAKRAGNVFLVAHTAVQALLAASSIVDVTQPGWAERLPTGLDEAFTQFLAELDTCRPGGLSSAKARAVLLPLAFAEGEGLPWVDLWAATATALSGSDVNNNDVALVREHAAAFIVEAVEQDRSVYRLYHERLAEHLRNSVASVKEAQQRIVGALRSLVPIRFTREDPTGRAPIRTWCCTSLHTRSKPARSTSSLWTIRSSRLPTPYAPFKPSRFRLIRRPGELTPATR